VLPVAPESWADRRQLFLQLSRPRFRNASVSGRGRTGHGRLTWATPFGARPSGARHPPERKPPAMANNAQNVSVGKPQAAGGIYAGPTSVAPPTDATTALPGTIVGLGYASDSGVVNGVEIDTENVVAWGGDTVLTIRTSRQETFNFTLIESLSEAVLAEVYGPDNVSTVAGELVVLHNNKELPA